MLSLPDTSMELNLSLSTISLVDTFTENNNQFRKLLETLYSTEEKLIHVFLYRSNTGDTNIDVSVS